MGLIDDYSELFKLVSQLFEPLFVIVPVYVPVLDKEVDVLKARVLKYFRALEDIAAFCRAAAFFKIAYIGRNLHFYYLFSDQNPTEAIITRFLQKSTRQKYFLREI